MAQTVTERYFNMFSHRLVLAFFPRSLHIMASPRNFNAVSLFPFLRFKKVSFFSSVFQLIQQRLVISTWAPKCKCHNQYPTVLCKTNVTHNIFRGRAHSLLHKKMAQRLGPAWARTHDLWTGSPMFYLANIAGLHRLGNPWNVSLKYT